MGGAIGFKGREGGRLEKFGAEGVCGREEVEGCWVCGRDWSNRGTLRKWSYVGALGGSEVCDKEG